jgi:hypothetical protein
MRQVSVVRFARRKIATTVLGTLVATAGIQGIANAGQAREIAVSTLGGPNRFSGPMHGVEDLRAMVTTNRTHITAVLGQAGIGDISTQFANVLATGYISETTVAPGTHFEWMALKRSGRPGLLRNVRWTGRQSFDAFQFSVEYAGYNYTFIVPKVCGNFALLSRTASPVAIAAPPPAPEPPPPPRAPEPVPEPPPVVQAPPPPPAVVVVEEKTIPYWIVTGYLGSSFSSGNTNQLPLANAVLATNQVDGGLAGGFQLARFWGSYVGAEILADFGVNQTTSRFLSTDPNLNNYMLNAIVKAPFGGVGRFEPYISGGLGWMNMRTSTFNVLGVTTITGPLGNTALVTTSDTVNTNQSKFGTDIGFGFFAFADRWGIRGDVRHYRSSTFDQEKLENGPTFADDYTQSLLSGLTLWRANLGIAFRW